MNSKYSIEDAEIAQGQYDGYPWLSYRLDTHGNDIYEMENNAIITVLNEEGEEVDQCELYAAPWTVTQLATRKIISLDKENACE